MDPAGSSGSCATCSATPWTTGRGKPVIVTVGYDDDAVAITVRDHGVGLRPGEAGAGLQPLLARRHLAQSAHRRHRPRPGDLARGRAAARRLAAGVGRAWPRRAVPPHPPAPCRAHADALAAAARSGRDRGAGRVSRPRELVAVALLAVLVPAALAGCTTVPRSSAPQVIRTLPVGPDIQQVAPITPTRGEQPRNLVQSFLLANAADSINRGSARTFLTPAARSRWSDSTVTIVDNNANVGDYVASKSQITVRGRVLGTVNTAGVYTPSLNADSGPAVSFVFGLGKVRGQIRINKPATGPAAHPGAVPAGVLRAQRLLLRPRAPLPRPGPAVELAERPEPGRVADERTRRRPHRRAAERRQQTTRSRRRRTRGASR